MITRAISILARFCHSRFVNVALESITLALYLSWYKFNFLLNKVIHKWSSCSAELDFANFNFLIVERIF